MSPLYKKTDKDYWEIFERENLNNEEYFLTPFICKCGHKVYVLNLKGTKPILTNWSHFNRPVDIQNKQLDFCGNCKIFLPENDVEIPIPLDYKITITSAREFYQYCDTLKEKTKSLNSNSKQ